MMITMIKDFIYNTLKGALFVFTVFLSGFFMYCLIIFGYFYTLSHPWIAFAVAFAIISAIVGELLK